MNDNEIIARYKKYEPFFGSWYIKRFIGEGGFAKVFEIVRNDFGNEYTSALKIITVSKTKSEIESMYAEGMTEQDIKESLKGIVEDTVREIQLMYKLRGNGNIVGYEDHAVVEHEDGLGWDIFIKMEFLTSLSSYIRSRQGRLAKRDIIRLGIDICKALETCQKYNIIHRDIKADNIFISNNGDFKLGDFGIARVIERKDTELSKKGTSAYMAPEVYRGMTYTSAVDIYSLGIVLYRLLNNNRAPFLPEYPKPISLDERDQALARRMSGEKFPKPAQVNTGRLPEIVLKACAYRPEERYSSPIGMRQELESILYDQEEMTNSDLITIYIEQGGESSFSFSNSGMPGTVNDGEATEVLREETPNTPAQNNAGSTYPGSAGAVNILCKKCGNMIERDAAFCPICGSSQREAQAAAPFFQQAVQQAAPYANTAKKPGIAPKKLALIGGICAAVIAAVGVTVGVVVSRSSSDKNEETQEETLLAEEETVEAGNAWEENVLMTMNIGSVEELEIEDLPTESDMFLNTGLRRDEIISVTFVDSLNGMSGDSWSLSDDGSKKVMAWAQTTDGGYDLYIGADGGVAANQDSVALFCNMPNLRRVSLNGCFHTENTDDMAGMFFQCYSLESVDFKGIDTSKVEDMNGMFISCENLRELDLSEFDTSSVENMNAMFAYCYGLTKLDVSSFDTSKVEDMGSMFSDCYYLTELDVSGFKTNRVSDMVAMFSGCSSLTYLDVSSFATQNVKDMSIMFYDCASLTYVDVSGFRTDSLLHTNNMFYGCYSLAELDVSNFDPYFVENMGYPGNIGSQANQSGQEIPDYFSDMYHEDFLGYDSWGWHETYIYEDDPNWAQHILYFSATNETSTDMAVRWNGPLMDVTYIIEGEWILDLIGWADEYNLSKISMFAMQGDTRSFRNSDLDSFVELFDVSIINSTEMTNDEQTYSVLYYVDALWEGDYTGYFYLIEDTAAQKLYVLEYFVPTSGFDLEETLEIILDMEPINLEDYGIDKRTGLLG